MNYGINEVFNLSYDSGNCFKDFGQHTVNKHYQH
jgi:hypothetical protein